jgi:hypothetical protein
MNLRDKKAQLKRRPAAALLEPQPIQVRLVFLGEEADVEPIIVEVPHDTEDVDKFMKAFCRKQRVKLKDCQWFILTDEELEEVLQREVSDEEESTE